VVSGTGRYLDDGAWFTLEPGTLFLSRPGIWHQIKSEQGMYLLYVSFEPLAGRCDPAALQQYQTMHTTERFFLQTAEQTSSVLLWHALMRQLEAPHRLSKEALSPLAHALLVSFYGTFREPDADLYDIPLPKADDRLLKRARIFIKDNLSQPLPLDSIARYFNVSGRHLSRMFADKLGVNYVNYVQQERIRHASELLAYTGLPIQAIADKTGFNSVHYFTRVFAKETGLPPGEYRSSLNEAASNDPHSGKRPPL
jgi:AraC-like DNA-binding protein